MSAKTGVGAPVLRKEDFRFITGKGQYTDDINRQDQTYAYFLRSPHAHANIKKLDTSAAKKMPGVLAVLFALARFSVMTRRRPCCTRRPAAAMADPETPSLPAICSLP